MITKFINALFLSFPLCASAASVCDVTIYMLDSNASYDNAVKHGGLGNYICRNNPDMAPVDCHTAFVSTSLKEWAGTDPVSWAAIQAYTGALGNRMMYVVDEVSRQKTYLPASASSGTRTDVQVAAQFTSAPMLGGWDLYISATVNLTEGEYVSLSVPASSPLCSLPAGVTIEKEVNLFVEKYIKLAIDFFPAAEVENWSNWSSRVFYITKKPSITLRAEPAVLDFSLIPVKTEKVLDFTVIPETDDGILVKLDYKIENNLAPSIQTDIINPDNNTVISQEEFIHNTGKKVGRSVRIRNISNTSGQQQMLLTITASIT